MTTPRKVLVFLPFLLFVSSNLVGQSDARPQVSIDAAQVQIANDLYQQGEAAYSQKQFAKAAEFFLNAFDSGFAVPEVAYQIAAAYALAGDKAQAFSYLDRVIQMAYSDPNQVKNDPDFAPLHDDPRWRKVLTGLDTNQSRYQEENAMLWDSPSIGGAFKPELTEDEKIAGLSKLWSEVKYNFVFPERLVETDWDKLYVTYLAKVRSAKSTYEYYRILEELCARLRDSHTNVYHPVELLGWVGLHTRLIENRLVVIEVWDPELRHEGITPGMEIVEINGKSARDYAGENVAPYQSASTKRDLDARTYEYFLLAGPAHELVQLTLAAPSGEGIINRTIRRKTSATINALIPKTPGFEFRVLPGNIGYAVLNSFSDNSVADEYIAAFANIAKTDALILDVRNNGGGNSGVGMRVLATLIDHPALLANWQTRDYKPIARAWGRPIEMLSLPGGDIWPDREHHYSKPVIVLTSSRTFSAAEDFLVAFDQCGRGTIIGEPSAGSTGQPLSFKLPGGGSGRVSTWRGTYPSGKTFLGVGVQPQKLVVPTVKDFWAGKDTVLDAAVAELHLGAIKNHRESSAPLPPRWRHSRCFLAGIESGPSQTLSCAIKSSALGLNRITEAHTRVHIEAQIENQRPMTTCAFKYSLNTAPAATRTVNSTCSPSASTSIQEGSSRSSRTRPPSNAITVWA